MKGADADARARAAGAAIRAAARALGYAACGFACADPFPEYNAALDERAERFPQAAEAYRRLRPHGRPRQGAPWARSIIVCIRPYDGYRLPRNVSRHFGRNYLVDRRLPACPDHERPQRMSAALKALGLRVRRGGVPDRAAAARAGVAAIGRNGFAYAPPHGSWINIETWRVNVALPAGTPQPTPCPDGCDLCLRACPTRALEAPYRMRMDRCIAWLTYHAPEPVAPDLWERMGAWIYGCDECQKVCPLNRDAATAAGEPVPWIEAVADLLTPAALARMDMHTYRERIHPLFWYIPATPEGMARWCRNATRAAKAIGC